MQAIFCEGKSILRHLGDLDYELGGSHPGARGKVARHIEFDERAVAGKVFARAGDQFDGAADVIARKEFKQRRVSDRNQRHGSGKRI